jgi:hypothetical protein
MTARTKAPLITIQDVTDWTVGEAAEAMSHRIEDDLKRPDSEVKEYLDWLGGASPPTPTPRLVERDMQRVYKAVGGRGAFVERLLREIEGPSVPPTGRRSER